MSVISRLLFLVKHPHRLVELFVFISGWVVLLLLPIIGRTVIQQPSRGSFYGLSGAWCWIGEGYGAERLIFLYVSILAIFNTVMIADLFLSQGWVFAALFSSFVIYSRRHSHLLHVMLLFTAEIALIYLRFAGFITNDHGKMQLRFRRSIPCHFHPSSIESPKTISYNAQFGVSGCNPPASFPHRLSTSSKRIHNNAELAYEDTWPTANTQLKRVARRIMWYPVGK